MEMKTKMRKEGMRAEAKGGMDVEMINEGKLVICFGEERDTRALFPLMIHKS